MSSHSSISALQATETFEKRIVFTATEGNVRRGLMALTSALSDLALSDEEHSSIELVMAETLNNIVEHAYANTSDGQIELRVARDPKGLAFRVSDRGKPMPGGEPPLGTQVVAGTPAAEVPEGGFGWFLIRELAYDIAYRRDGCTNIMSFRMNVGCLRHETPL